MSNVKKAYVAVIAFLEANQDKKVKSVLEEVKTMCAAKSAGGSASAFAKNDAGETTHIRCSYFNIWLPVSVTVGDAEVFLFGAKSGSASGYNPMCKEGANMFAKKQREFKQANDGLLEAVGSGEVAPHEIAEKQAEFEAIRTERPAFSVPDLGFAELEEATSQPAEYYTEVYEAHVAAEDDSEAA